MNIDLHGKTAWVGGASRGIGKAIARQLAQQGAQLVLVARNAEKLEAVRQGLPNPALGQHQLVALDYRHQDQVKAATASILAQQPIHILINNTGGPAAGSLLEAPLASFSQAFELHLQINQLLAQAFVPSMKAEGYGRIVNVISTSVKQPIPGLGVSNTIRGAVASWAKTLAREVAPWGITVNNILPGKTDTERLQEIIDHQAQISGQSPASVTANMQAAIPMGRFAAAGEIAAAVGFLASPAASFVTGINLPVDGGEIKSL